MTSLENEIITKDQAVNEIIEFSFIPQELEYECALEANELTDSIFSEKNKMTRDEFDTLFLKRSNERVKYE